jgi:hypothetical protein
MGTHSKYTLLITDESLYVVGDPIQTWTTLDVTLKFNEPGSGRITAPADPYLVAQLAAGNRIVVVRDPLVPGVAPYFLTAGPIEKWTIERSDGGDDNAGNGNLTINFADDLALLAAHAAYPDPAHTADAQTANNWTFSGNAELALRALVDQNAGPSALVQRRVPLLALGAIASVGTAVTPQADRMEPLLDVARRIAVSGGGLGFRTRQSGTQILFEVHQPTDRSTSVRFSFGLHNVQYISYEVSAPTATTAIVGGQGTGADAAMIEVTNAADEAAWGRYEKYVARAGSVAPAQLTEDGNQALSEGAATERLATNVVDTPDQRFGIHYSLGDKVAIETLPGLQYSDIIGTVHIQAWATAGEMVAPIVGSQAEKSDPLWLQQITDLYRRMGKLERSVMPAL